MQPVVCLVYGSLNSLALSYSASRFASLSLYITYNGDFFDWPFIATRCQIHGIDLSARIGVSEVAGEYMGRFSVHMDAFCCQ
jgi:hypothetical protein